MSHSLAQGQLQGHPAEWASSRGQEKVNRLSNLRRLPGHHKAHHGQPGVVVREHGGRDHGVVKVKVKDHDKGKVKVKKVKVRERD